MNGEDEVGPAPPVADIDRRNLYRLLMEAPAAIAILRGRELRYELSNPRNRELAGERDLVGFTIREALPEFEAEGLIAVCNEVFATDRPFMADELPVLLPATATRPERLAYITGTYQPLHGPGGEVEGIMVFAFEVTDQVHARRRAQEAEARLRLAVEAAGVGTWDFYPQTRRLECDARYKALFGFPPDAPEDPQIFASAIVKEDFPGVQAAVARAFDPQGDGEYRIEYRVRGADDIERFIEMRGRAFFDERGKPTRFTGTGADISAQKRSADRLRFLAEAGATLGSSLDYRATLAQIARLAVPRLADWCAVDVLADDGAVEQLAVAHVDPEKEAMGKEIRRRYPPPPGRGVRQVLETARPIFLPEVPDAMLEAGARDPDHLRMLRALGLRSAILVPLVVGGKAAGVVSLVLADSGRHYQPEDLAAAEQLASRAAAAMDNARLYQAAERAIEKRDDFLSIASHELKTPLSSLGLYLDACRRELGREGKPVDLERMGARLERASVQLDRVTVLVNRLLDVSRLSAGRLELDLTEGDLAELARDVVARLGDQATRAGCELNLETLGDTRGRFDGPRLDEVLTNLLANALKFGAGKPIVLTVGGDQRALTIAVADHGPGIRAEDRQRVFERFERTSEARNIGGIGLGLWISRQIVVAHGGSIEIDDQSLQGTRFIVELPRYVPAAVSDSGG